MIVAALVGIVVALAITLPLAWKWQLGVQRVAVGVLLLGVLAALCVAALDLLVGIGSVTFAILTVAVTVRLGLVVLAWRFYRDPERTPPAEEGVVVSPAD